MSQIATNYSSFPVKGSSTTPERKEKEGLENETSILLLLA
jgi:hypothetical protein